MVKAHCHIALSILSVKGLARQACDYKAGFCVKESSIHIVNLFQTGGALSHHPAEGILL